MNPLLAAESVSASVPGRTLSTLLELHAPLRLVGDDWTSPLGWTPGWFRPYVHQAAAFERLTTFKRFSQPTLLVGGKRAGKTEAYLYPILDHCLRQSRNQRPGMKALVVCRTTGVAREHARRAATLIGWDKSLAGVTIGCHPGATGHGGAPIVVGELAVPVDPAALGASPPDLVFTTAEALSSFMVDPGFDGLWATTTRESLRYLVVEDLQAYTDSDIAELALGLRRIGAKLHMQSVSAGPPLGGSTVIGTIASSTMDADQLLSAAALGSRLFGVKLHVDSIVVESRHTAAELASSVDRSARVPAPAALAGKDPDDVASIARELGLADVAGDPVALGSRLGLHPLTVALIGAASDGPVELDAVIAALGEKDPSWRVDAADAAGRGAATAALARVLSLLASARRRVGAMDVALMGIDVHVWLAAQPDEPRPAVLAQVLPALWRVSSGPDRRTLALTGSVQEASHGAAILRQAVGPAAAGPEAPSVIAREVTSISVPEARAAVEGAFDMAHPEAPLVLLSSTGSDVGVDEGTLSSVVLLGAPADTGRYRSRTAGVGRDGGSSLVITIVGGDGRDRALGAHADTIVGGPLRLPKCQVDDGQLLARYYMAEVADSLLASGRRALHGSVAVEQAIRGGFDPEAVFGALLRAGADPQRASAFVGSLVDEGTDTSMPDSDTGSPGPASPVSDASASGAPASGEASAGASTHASPTQPSGGAPPRTLFGRPAADGDGAGAVFRPGQEVPSPLPTLGAGQATGLPLLGAAVEHAVGLVHSPEALDEFRAFALDGVEAALGSAIATWRAQNSVQRDRLRATARLTRADASGRGVVDPTALRGEASAQFDAARVRRELPWPAALAELGVLPAQRSGEADVSHVVGGDSVLDVALWANEPGGFQVRFRHHFDGDDPESGSWPSSVLVPGSTVFSETHRLVVDGIELVDGFADGASGTGGSDGSDRAVLPLVGGVAGRDHVLHAVVAHGPEIAARDDGSPVGARALPTVTVTAGDAGAAWCLPGMAFGAQVLRSATLRAAFGTHSVCGGCGVVHGVRVPDLGDQRSVHRIWCSARTAEAPEAWEAVELVSTLAVPMALRVLVPVSRFDADRRVAAFESVMLAGIEQSGRSIADLLVVRPQADDAGDTRTEGAGNDAGGGSLRSLVLCSRSSDGDALLGWLSDPAEWRGVLQAGVTSGAAGAAGRVVQDLIGTDWRPQRIDSLDQVDARTVECNELSDALVVALRAWAESDEHASLVPAQDGAALGLAVTLDEHRSTYQVDAAGATSGSVLVVRSVTDNLPPVTVVPAGHDVGADEHVGLVWRLSWVDVDEFRAASLPGSSFDAAALSLFSDQARAAADARQVADSGVFDVAALEQNPLALLLDVLARPSVSEWRRVATSAVNAAATGAGQQPGPGATGSSGRGRAAWANIEGLAAM